MKSTIFISILALTTRRTHQYDGGYQYWTPPDSLNQILPRSQQYSHSTPDSDPQLGKNVRQQLPPLLFSTAAALSSFLVTSFKTNELRNELDECKEKINKCCKCSVDNNLAIGNTCQVLRDVLSTPVDLQPPLIPPAPTPFPVSFEFIGNRVGVTRFQLLFPITAAAGAVTETPALAPPNVLQVGPMGRVLGNDVRNSAVSIADFSSFVDAVLAITDTLDDKIRRIVNHGPLTCPSQCNV